MRAFFISFAAANQHAVGFLNFLFIFFVFFNLT